MPAYVVIDVEVTRPEAYADHLAALRRGRRTDADARVSLAAMAAELREFAASIA